jgi:hypothetical protein
MLTRHFDTNNARKEKTVKKSKPTARGEPLKKSRLESSSRVGRFIGNDGQTDRKRAGGGGATALSDWREYEW